MNRMTGAALLGLLFAVAGCGGGGGTADKPIPVPGGGSPGGGTGQGAPMAPQPALFDCNSVFPFPGSQVEAALEGVWNGTLVDCASGTSGQVFAYVSGDGILRIQWAAPLLNGDVMRSAVKIAGDTFAGEGRYFNAAGGWSTGLKVGGLIRDGTPIKISDSRSVERDRMEGLWATDAGAYGYFALDYAAGQNHPAIALQAWPAEWDVWASPSVTAGEWTINPQGAVNGEDVDGCQYAGQFAAAKPQFFYELNLTVASCALAGSYTGIGRPTGGPFNDLLYVAVDDGDQRSLVMLLGSR